MARIELMPRARHQLFAAYDWWRKHRDKAPDALEVDFAEVLEKISQAPNTGKFLRHQRTGVVRYFLLERVRYYETIARRDLASRHPPSRRRCLFAERAHHGA